MRADVLALYRSLGGRLDRPALRPGAWDRALVGGDVVELDEELHFNRYRARTLEWSWSRGLPWRDAHLAMCRAHESKCVSAGRGANAGRTHRASSSGRSQRASGRRGAGPVGCWPGRMVGGWCGCGTCPRRGAR